MSKSKKPSSSLNDEDMHTLFESNEIDVPTNLDVEILATARAAVESEPNTQRESRYKNWSLSWTQGFAAAAVVVLGIVIVPTMISSVQPSHELTEVTTEFSLAESSNELPAPAPAPAPMSIDSIAQDETSPDGLPEKQTMQTLKNARANAGHAAASSVTPKINNKQAFESGVGSELAIRAPAAVETEPDALETEGVPDATVLESLRIEASAYRATREAWVAEILRLHETQETEKSREELTLFLMRYPNHVFGQELPKELR